MKHFLSSLPYPNKDHWSIVHHPDRLIVGSSNHVIGSDEHMLGKTLHPDVRKSKEPAA
jgi:cell wall assembly regulator SMI1